MVMENNFQMFFPCNSSSSSMAHLSAYPISSNNMSSQANFSTGYGHDHNNKRIISPNHATMRINGTDHDHDNDHSMITKLDHRSNLQGGEISSTELISNNSGPTITGKIIKKGEKKIRKPKYAFQTRSQVDILDDGYRWRKYGQKAVKNNKFPRSYYRCTHQGCNVKKQVQRLTKDEGVVVTTYEGMHTHPIEKHTDNFEHILSQMQIYTPF